MNMLEDIIRLCHERHGERESLRQRKTVVTPALFKRPPFHIKVHCSRANALTLDALESADISFMPIGHASENDQVPLDCGGERFLKRQRGRSWRMRQWNDSWGIQIYTGIPSGRDGAHWHDIEFKYDAICSAPDAVSSCLETLLNAHANPLLTLTKSGGLRFSCRVQEYLHSNTDEDRFFIFKKDQPTEDAPNRRVVYLEVLGEEGYSQWDLRYEILLGNLLEPPVISKEVLFVSIHQLREAFDEIELRQAEISETEDVVLPSFGSTHLDLAKAAFLKRGYSYLRVDDGCHHWKLHDENGIVKYVSLWEDQGIVWVRATTLHTDIPTRAVAITDIWDDTGISPPNLVSKKVLLIRKGDLSPLTIKRPTPKLYKQQTVSKHYKSIQEQTSVLKEVLTRDTRILALITTEDGIFRNTEAETHLLNNRATFLNIASRVYADAAAERYATKNLSSVARWRSIFYRWDQVKDIPIEDRMANPFQHGNVCEDTERIMAFMNKGGNPRESICPNCPVYTACQERGYLSQPQAMKSANAQISPVSKLFFEPRHAHLIQHILENVDEERICIIDEHRSKIADLFFECVLTKEVLEQWIATWKGYALGNFAVAIMNALETQVVPSRNPIRQVRSAVEAFKQYEDQIIEQMCYINVQGRVVAHKTVDPDTGSELSRLAIAIKNIDGQNASTAYIPLDADAKDRLHAIGLPTISPQDYTTNEDISIPMQMTEAVRIGVLDVRTIESIALFPTVCSDPEWTYWHQLTRFFEHYPRDADAPMRWNDRFLKFWLPPRLHPGIKRLLIISPFLTEGQLRRAFPSEDMDVIRVEPTTWLPDNRVFQIRSSSRTLNEIINNNSHTNRVELSKIGERYIRGIRAEIERDLSIRHAIFANYQTVDKLLDMTEMSNVRFIRSFKSLFYNDIDIDSVQVFWIVGTPKWREGTIWQQAQMLFGNDVKPLEYGEDMWVDDSEDERIQEVYHQNISGLLTLIVGRVGMNRCSGKTVVLLNSFDLPDITDRPETLLFDWEDFEIAGGLDKLEETIRIRERFEAERENLNAGTPRKEVERVLGCSTRQANRVLNKLRGGNIPRVSFREQILFLLSSGPEKTTASLVAAIDSSPQAIGNELKRLLDAGEIVRVRRGVYTLPQDE